MNKGVVMLMNLAVFATRLGRERMLSEAQRAEMRGVSGVMNIEFTGADGGTWHVEFGDGRVVMATGAHPDPRATVRVKPEDYLAMVAGDLSYSSARMTGKVRVAGDGHFGLIFGAFVSRVQALASAPGVRGAIGRFLVKRALARGGYQRGRAGDARNQPRGEKV